MPPPNRPLQQLRLCVELFRHFDERPSCWPFARREQIVPSPVAFAEDANSSDASYGVDV